MSKMRIKKEGGFVLIQAVMLVVVATIVIGGMISMSRFGLNESKLDLESTQAKQLGYSVMEQVKFNISETFYKYYMASPNAQTVYKLRWFDTINPEVEQVGYEGVFYNVPKRARFNHADTGSEDVAWRRNGRYTVSLDVRTPSSMSERFSGTDGSRDLKITVQATVGGTTRTFEEIVRYKISAGIFRYAYLQNQPLTVRGGGDSFVINGDLRTNGNLTIPSGGVTMAGDMYASVNKAFGDDGVGSITGGSLSAVELKDYNSNANTSQQARPVFTPNGPYVNGYTGASSAFPFEETVEIPAKGDLQPYREQAVKSNGFIKQNGKIIVSHIFEADEPGYDGLEDTPDDGTLVLDGTKGPIEVHGTVVVEGDVIIKGTFKGQGTVYAARNIHVIDDVTYQQRPIWNKGGQLPDPDSTKVDKSAEAEFERNQERDLIGWIAKGNIILGNPEAGNNMNVLGPLFDTPNGHVTEESDFANGYDSDGNPANGYFFDGNYNYKDGGQRIEQYERPATDLEHTFYIPTWKADYERVEVQYKETYTVTETETVSVKTGTEEVWVEDNSMSSGGGEGGHWETRDVYEDREVEKTTEKERWVSYRPKKFTTKLVQGPKINRRLLGEDEEIYRDDRNWIDTGDGRLLSGDYIKPGETITITAYNADGTVAETFTTTVHKDSHNLGIKLTQTLPESFRKKQLGVQVAPRERIYKDRKYYEPSITTEQMMDLAGNNAPSVMDGVYFTNHLFGGLVDGLEVNGSVITRDSGVRFNTITFNWDIRLAEAKVNNDRITDTGLPKSYSDPETLYRREL